MTFPTFIALAFIAFCFGAFCGYDVAMDGVQAGVLSADGQVYQCRVVDLPKVQP